MMTFDQFQQTAMWFADLDKAGVDTDYDEPTQGLVYAGDCYLVGPLATGHKEATQYSLILANMDWIGEREKLERILWAWHYLTECCDDVVLSTNDGSLDDFIIASCDGWGLECDGDHFGVVFSGSTTWTYDDASTLFTAWRKQQQAMRYSIKPTFDREGNEMFHLSVYIPDGVDFCDNDFYTLGDAKSFVGEVYPNVRAA